MACAWSVLRTTACQTKCASSLAVWETCPYLS